MLAKLVSGTYSPPLPGDNQWPGDKRRRPGYPPPMPRPLVALVTGLVGFTAYVVGAITLADALPRHRAAQAVYVLLTGTHSVVPVHSLMIWAARG